MSAIASRQVRGGQTSRGNRKSTASGAALAVVGVALCGLLRIAGLPASIVAPLAAALALPLVVGWLSFDLLLVVLSPFMFFSGVTGDLHIAVTDIIFPIALVRELRRMDGRSRDAALAVLKFGMVAAALFSASMLWTALSDRGFVLSLAFSSCLKTATGIGYAALFASIAARMSKVELVGMFRAWVWAAAAVSAGTVVTAIGGVGLVPNDGTRSNGFFQDPNLYAGYLLVSMAIAIAAEVMTPSRWTVPLVAVLAVGIVLTASRGALATLAVMTAIAVTMIGARRIRFAFGCLAGGAGVLLWLMQTGNLGLLGIPAFERLDVASSQVGVDPRVGLWGRAILLWREHPIFGVGTGQFPRFSKDVYKVLPSGYGYVAHNTYLSFLAEMGVLGFLMCIVPIALTLKRVYASGDMSYTLKNAYALGVVAFCFEMLSLNLQNVRYVWIFVGILVGVSQGSRLRNSRHAHGGEVTASWPDHMKNEPDRAERSSARQAMRTST